MQREGLPDERPDPACSQLGQGLPGQPLVLPRAKLDLPMPRTVIPRRAASSAAMEAKPPAAAA
jgi:hypothetical protein